MTQDNLTLILTNALCCSAKLAVKVSDMYFRGDNCADLEFKKLKLLIDKIESLKCYEFIVGGNEEQMNKLTHDIMRDCDICDCQLK